jgi:hypothetical protein
MLTPTVWRTKLSLAPTARSTLTATAKRAASRTASHAVTSRLSARVTLMSPLVSPQASVTSRMRLASSSRTTTPSTCALLSVAPLLLMERLLSLPLAVLFPHRTPPAHLTRTAPSSTLRLLLHRRSRACSKTAPPSALRRLPRRRRPARSKTAPSSTLHRLPRRRPRAYLRTVPTLLSLASALARRLRL